MSAVPAVARPRRAPAPEPRKHLEIAPSRAQRRARPRLVHAILTVAGIGVILLGQLLLSILLADGAYQISGLQAEQRDLLRQQEALTESLEQRSSTQNLIANAEQMGMVVSGNPVFLDLATGAVSGSASAAGGSLLGGQGNLIGNALLDGSTVLDAEALGTGEVAAGGQIVEGGQIVDDDQTGGSGAPSSPEAADPGTLPSPTTH